MRYIKLTFYLLTYLLTYTTTITTKTAITTTTTTAATAAAATTVATTTAQRKPQQELCTQTRLHRKPLVSWPLTLSCLSSKSLKLPLKYVKMVTDEIPVSIEVMWETTIDGHHERWPWMNSNHPRYRSL